MNILVTCGNCQKRYQVDVRLGGRTMKCKACGQALKIPRPEDELLEPAEAPPAVAAPAPVRPPAPAQRPAAAPPALPRAAGEALASAEPELHLAPPPMPAAPAVAEDGTMVPAPRARKPVYQPIKPNLEGERDYRGFRINRGHTNSTLATMENLAVTIGEIVFWIDSGLFMLYILLEMIMLHRDNSFLRDHGMPTLSAMNYVVAILIPLILLTVYVTVCVPLCGFAAGMAGKILMFDIPEEPRWRLTAVDAISTVILVGGFAIIYLSQFFGDIDVERTVGQSVGLLMLVTLPLVIPMHFGLTWLVLRLKITEMLLVWPMILLAHVVTWGTLITLFIAAVGLLL